MDRSMRQMFGVSLGLHGFFLGILFFVTVSIGWKTPYLQTYQVNLVELAETKKVSPRPLVNPTPQKKVEPKKMKPQKVHLPKKEVIQKEILQPTIVQKPTKAPESKPTERQKKVQALKEKVASITQGKAQASAPIEEASIPSPQIMPTLDIPDFPFPMYKISVDKKLRRNWSAPPVGSMSEVHEAVVVFQISRNGKVNGAKIEKSSGNQYFDLAALRAVYDSDPLPPLPREYRKGTLLVHVSFLLNRNL